MAKEKDTEKPATPTDPVDVSKMFENPNVGETFGGSYEPMKLDEGQTSPLLEFIKTTPIPIKGDEGEEDKIIEAPVACVVNDPEKIFSMPIGAVFQKHWKEAGIKKGDRFAFKRYNDATKRHGRGQGNKIQVYAIKVFSRAADRAKENSA